MDHFCRQDFSDTSLTFPDNYSSTVKFSDISRFSRKVVALQVTSAYATVETTVENHVVIQGNNNKWHVIL